MKLLNTVLLLIGLLAFVMYLKNLFDIREGVLSDANERDRRRCPSGYKKNPTYIMTHSKPRTNERKQLIRNMKTRTGKPVRGGRWRRLYKKKNLKVYDYECRPKKSRGGGKNRGQLARGLASLAAGGARHISVNLGR